MIYLEVQNSESRDSIAVRAHALDSPNPDLISGSKEVPKHHRCSPVCPKHHCDPGDHSHCLVRKHGILGPLH